MIEKVQPPPFGKRVRLTQNYATRSQFGTEAGDTIGVTGERATTSHIGARRPPLIIPKGTEGTIARGYGSSVIDDSECPVRFDFNNPDVPEILETPWNILEFIGDKDTPKQPLLFQLFPALQKLVNPKRK